eukprot:TRINITY_DN12099_c0_g2_i1.p8 TRINITY_DN12099_c0_g2~~TRINITY_DN12099_c0_g2_i1.p8  ORF type:complete len:117 (+),score=18.37 TRINITY_DN12099_c0_g2_i1:92-442(+)
MSISMGSAYKGPPSVPHVREDFFKCYFAAANLSLLMVKTPGRFLGTEIHPRKYSRDLIIAACEENAQRRQMVKGEVPTSWYRKPSDGAETWERKWWNHLHWKRWQLERTGPCYRAS